MKKALAGTATIGFLALSLLSAVPAHADDSQPENPADGSSQSVTFTCDDSGQWRVITTNNSSGTKVDREPLTEEEVLIHCNPTPGDLPIAAEPEVPEAPVELPVESVPASALTCAEAGTQITAENPLYSAALDTDGDGIGCEVQGTYTAEKAETPVAAAEGTSTPAPLAHVGSTEKPSELAYTGFNWGVFSAAILALGAGFGLLRMNRKLA